MYAENKELGIDHCLSMWSLILDNPKIDFVIGLIRNELQKIEKEEREREPFDENKRIVVEASWLDRV